jgi:hypothetical protein
MHLVLFVLESIIIFAMIGNRCYGNQSQVMHYFDSVVESFSPNAM